MNSNELRAIFCFIVLALFSTGALGTSFTTIKIFQDAKKGSDTGDLDNDGDNDIVLCDQTGELVYYLNKAPSWERHVIQGNLSNTNKSGWHSWTCHLADVDQDGRLDVVGGRRKLLENNFSFYQVGWYRNGGSPKNWEFKSVSLLESDIIIHWVEAGDIDGDGDIDLAVAKYDTIEWHENTKSGWFKHVLDKRTYGAHCALLDDFDGDGDLEIMGCSYYMGEVKIHQHRGGVIFQDFPPQGSWTAATLDFDKDGDRDFVTIGTGGISVYKNNDNKNFSTLYTSKTGGFAVTVGDLNNDGKEDILAGNNYGVSLYENTGNFSLWREKNILTLRSGASALSVNDMNFDGKLDFTASANNVDKIRVVSQQ